MFQVKRIICYCLLTYSIISSGSYRDIDLLAAEFRSSIERIMVYIHCPPI